MRIRTFLFTFLSVAIAQVSQWEDRFNSPLLANRAIPRVRENEEETKRIGKRRDEIEVKDRLAPLGQTHSP